MEDGSYTLSGKLLGAKIFLARTEPDSLNINSVRLLDPSFTSDFAVHSAYPNPFNSATNFTFSLTGTNNLKLSIHDLNGKEIAILSEGTHSAGYYKMTWQPEGLPSGAYCVRMETSNKVQVQQVVLMR